MAGFKTTLFIEPIGDRFFRVVNHPLTYEADNGEVYEVPVWTMTDLASTWKIPIVSELYSGVAPMSATLHDHLYDGSVTRKRADELFYEAMYYENEHYRKLGQYGIPDVVRLRLFQGVRDFGSSSYRGKPEDNI